MTYASELFTYFISLNIIIFIFALIIKSLINYSPSQSSKNSGDEVNEIGGSNRDE